MTNLFLCVTEIYKTQKQVLYMVLKATCQDRNATADLILNLHAQSLSFLSFLHYLPEKKHVYIRGSRSVMHLIDNWIKEDSSETCNICQQWIRPRGLK